ncbi:hypothetical protein GCM10022378_09090 [Salinicoccus jeotgali]|uniref:Uncharacterized protein n=1 Tax=Salinicoccus jeotgali TaxID=381634 RepID=A0ABP7EP07_9STAP
MKNKINDDELLVGGECIKKFVNELGEIGVRLFDKNKVKVTEE